MNYFKLRHLKPYFKRFIIVFMMVIAFNLFKDNIINVFSTYNMLPALFLAGITNPDDNSARYMLSALVQSEAAIIAVVITLSLVAVQLSAASYSPKVIKIFIETNELQFILIIYSFSIIYGLAVISLIESKNIKINNLDWGISVAFVLGIFNLLILFPYIKNTLSLINPSRIIETLSEEITKDKVFSAEYPGDKNDPFQNIVYIIISSLMRYDIPTVEEGLNAIESRIEDILKNYDFSKEEDDRFAKIIFYHFYNIADLAVSREDVSAAFIVMNYIERLGKFAIKQQSEELLFMTIDTLENVGLLAARRKLINTTSISSAYLKDIGLDAYEKGLNHLVYLVPEAISNIGEAAAKEGLPEAVKIAAENLKSIGTEATTHELIDSPRDVVISTIDSLEKIGGIAAKGELLDAERSVMYSLLSIGIKATQKFGENYIAQDWIREAVNALKNVGTVVSKKGLDDAAEWAGIYLKQIGLEAVRQEIVAVANEAVDALAEIGYEAMRGDQYLAKTPSSIVMALIEVRDEVATKEQFGETKHKAISHIEKIKSLADKQNDFELLRLCNRYINPVEQQTQLKF